MQGAFDRGVPGQGVGHIIAWCGFGIPAIIGWVAFGLAILLAPHLAYETEPLMWSLCAIVGWYGLMILIFGGWMGLLFLASAT